MNTLYSSGCTLCNVVAKKLRDEGIEFEYIEATPEDARILTERGHKSMPVLIAEDWEWSGQDCLEAIASGEIL